MKKTFILLLAFLVLLCSMSILSSCTVLKKTSDNVYLNYSLNADKKSYAVSGSNITDQTSLDRWDMVDVTIPATYRGLPVTDIRPNAFKNSAILKSVTLPETITVIGAGAFWNCVNLESVYIPKHVARMYGNSFEGCSSLHTVAVDPENPNLCSVDGNVYSKDQQTMVLYAPGKSQAEFEIPAGVTTIQKLVFVRCNALEQIIIPPTVTEIHYDAISFCKSLQGISVHPNNQVYQSIDGNLYSKDGQTFIHLYTSEPNTSLDLPIGVTAIADYAAYYADHLTSITIPDTVVSIGEYAFSQTGLRSVSIPIGVTHISHNSFAGCESLEEAVFAEPSGWKVIPYKGKFLTTKTLDPADLEDHEAVARYLAETYQNYDWHREG